MRPAPDPSAGEAPLVRAEGLVRIFGRRGLWRGTGQIRAVAGIDLSVGRGEAVGVVGESGSGKSTLGRLLLALQTPSAGRVVFDGIDLAAIGARALRRLRPRMQMVFQDPFASLDPRRRIGAQVADGLLIHGLASRAEAAERARGLLEQVGLEPSLAARLPHEFSGGQRQRIAIARALATRPDFLVADEPVAALDVSIQAQIVNLLADLREDLGLSLLFISHDLHVVRHLCDRIVVMYLGHVVEEGPTDAIFRDPAHPYTRALLAASPSLRRREKPAPLGREPPGVGEAPSGCVFLDRCPEARPNCMDAMPLLGTPRHESPRRVACWRAAEIAR